MGCRRQPERVVCRRDFGSVCLRWGQYCFESSVQTTIALLMLGLKTRFWHCWTSWPCESLCSTCGRSTQNGGFSGQVQALPFWCSTEGCGAVKQRLRNHLGSFLSMQSTFVLLLRPAPNSRNSITFTKGKQRASPELHPRRLGSAWKSLSSKNNIVIVEAVETDFLRLISAFSAQPSTKQKSKRFQERHNAFKKTLILISVANAPSGMFKRANHGCECWRRVLYLWTLSKNMGKMGEEFLGEVVTCWQV